MNDIDYWARFREKQAARQARQQHKPIDASSSRAVDLDAAADRRAKAKIVADLVERHGFTGAARMLGVTPQAVRARCKRYGFDVTHPVIRYEDWKKSRRLRGLSR